MNRTEAAAIVTGNRISWASMGGAWSGIVSDVSSYTSGETFIYVDVDGGGTECFRLHVGDDIAQIIEVEKAEMSIIQHECDVSASGLHEWEDGECVQCGDLRA